MVNTSNAVKIIAAFLAGIVIALGSALIYVKVADRRPSHAVTADSSTRPAQPAASGAAPQSLPNADQTPAVDTSAAKQGAKRAGLSSIGHRFRHNDDPTEPESTDTAPPVPQNPPLSKSVVIVTPRPPVVTPVRRSIPAPVPTRVVQPAAHRDTAPQQIASRGTSPLAPIQPPPAPAGSAPAPVQPAPAPVHTAPAPVQVAPAPRQPRTITLAAGTNLVVRLGESLSTDHNYSGDAFRATLDAPIIQEGAIIADRGSKVLGQVVAADKAGRVKGVSDLSLKLMEINTTDGQRVFIQTSPFDQKGVTGTGRDAAKVGGAAALGAIIGAVAGGGTGAGIGAGVGGLAGAGDVLLTRGKPAVLNTETRLTFRLSAPVTITEKLNY